MSNTEKALEKAKAGLVKTDKPKTLKDWIVSDEFKSRLVGLLPKHIDEKRIIGLFLNSYNKTPALGRCNMESVFGALLQAATLGLEPDTEQGLCYIIPFGDKATFVMGYKGLIDLIHRSGKVLGVTAEIIYENDEIEIEQGTNRKIHHKPYWLCGKKEGGNILGGYMLVQFTNGQFWFHPAPIADVWKRKEFSKSSKSPSSPWQQWPEEMIKKTFIKMGTKDAPQSLEVRDIEGRYINIDAIDEKIIETKPLLQMPADIKSFDLDIDPETGEVLGEQA